MTPRGADDAGGRQSSPELLARTSPHLKALTGQGDLPCTAFAVFAHLQRLERLRPEAAALVLDDRAALLDWYLTELAPVHLPHRLPLSDDDVAFLLSDDPLAALPFPVPRIVLWHALRPHSGAPDMASASTSQIDLARWWAHAMAPRFGLDDCLIPDRYRDLIQPQSPEPASGAPTSRPPETPAVVSRGADVQVIGPLHQQSGLGRATRLSIETFRRAGMKVLVTDFAYGFPSPDAIDPDFAGSNVPGPAPAAVIHLNPNMLPWLFAVGQGDFPSRQAGYFFWELDRPATCDFLALDLVDEIWTASAFVKSIYDPYFGGIVDHVGLATPGIASPDRSATRTALRAQAGLPPDSFVFISVFDGFSYVERKNPLGAIRAFQSAFPNVPGVALVIKTHNRPASGATGQGAVWRQIENICAADRRIRIIDRTTSHPDLLGLIAGADAFVSLHRAEGWGLGVLEAMQLGVPVIATAYSGTEDFCTPDTAWRVPFSLIPVRHGDYVHAEPHHRWADPDLAAAAAAMTEIRTRPDLRSARAAAASELVEDTLSFDAVGVRYTQALERLLARA